MNCIKLLSILLASEPIGKSSAELKQETGLSRDRVHAICKEYMDIGILYKTARYGKYRLCHWNTTNS
jgi:DNA-binding IclR family transcriptional regulator